jgi:hypothetical protein
MSNIRTRFIIEVNFSSTDQRAKLLNLYGDSFYALIKEAKSNKYFGMDYKQLPSVRKFVDQYKTLEEMLPIISKHISDERIVKLIQVSPLFNMSPTELKSYILFSLGLRELIG